VTISGFTIPALSTRRAETEVEIRDGESFVVSGLLDHRTTDSLSRIPGIADIPILGQLFKSKSLNRSIVELVVIVTATVVDPLGQPQPTAEPKMVFPNMDSSDFDASATKALQTAPPSLKAVKP
jgi:pilus assembly protein CpaC